ncbi:DJ-1/PfpI family protein [Streptomyces sp. bgisy084]|uniref:DJ-1/PfpI family protein n=1 Tax=Streptomyces sp. bgisy084 TaxID=3413777 RepID=UPI003D7549EE
MQIAFLVAPEGVEQAELTEPWQAVLDSGDIPHLVSTRSGRIQAFHHLDKADTFPVDHTVDTVDVADYGGLVLPGGVANPDALRMHEGARWAGRQVVIRAALPSVSSVILQLASWRDAGRGRPWAASARSASSCPAAKARAASTVRVPVETQSV